MVGKIARRAQTIQLCRADTGVYPIVKQPYATFIFACACTVSYPESEANRTCGEHVSDGYRNTLTPVLLDRHPTLDSDVYIQGQRSKIREPLASVSRKSQATCYRGVLSFCQLALVDTSLLTKEK